jgi:hypothetical protein
MKGAIRPGVTRYNGVGEERDGIWIGGYAWKLD